MLRTSDPTVVDAFLASGTRHAYARVEVMLMQGTWPPAARKAFGGSLKKLVAQGDKDIKKSNKRVTDAALARMKCAHKEAVEDRNKKRKRPAQMRPWLA